MTTTILSPCVDVIAKYAPASYCSEFTDEESQKMSLGQKHIKQVIQAVFPEETTGVGKAMENGNKTFLFQGLSNKTYSQYKIKYVERREVQSDSGLTKLSDRYETLCGRMVDDFTIVENISSLEEGWEDMGQDPEKIDSTSEASSSNYAEKYQAMLTILQETYVYEEENARLLRVKIIEELKETTASCQAEKDYIEDLWVKLALFQLYTKDVSSALDFLYKKVIGNAKKIEQYETELMVVFHLLFRYNREMYSYFLFSLFFYANNMSKNLEISTENPYKGWLLVVLCYGIFERSVERIGLQQKQ